MKCLEEGKKVRKCQWRKDEYIYMHGGAIVTQGKLNYNFYNPANSEWELYDDRKEASTRLRELYRNCCDLFENFDCDMDEWEVCNNHNTFEKVKELLVTLEEVNKYYKLDK
jgi:hypothetical protein